MSCDPLGSSDSPPSVRGLRGSMMRIATLWFVLAPLSWATVGVEIAEPDPTSDFTLRRSTEHFEFASDSPAALENLSEIAEDTQRRVRAWLAIPPPRVESKIHVYICSDVEELYTLEDAFGLPSSRESKSDRSFHGRCYPDVGLIVVPFDRAESMRWQIAHEVTHSVFHELVGRNVEIVNEGLAELVPNWILHSNAASPEELDARYDLYDYRCAQAFLTREIPTLESFATGDALAFYDPNTDWLGYALSWKFVKMLVESDHPRIHGRFAQFLRVLGAGNAAWPSLRAVYDTEILAVAWRAELERSARWKPLFGQWRLDAGAMHGTVVGQHSGAAIAASPAWPGESFTIGFTLDRVPPPGMGFGFALEVTSEDDFVYVEFRPNGQEISVARRALGRWTELYVYRLPGTVDMLAPIGKGGRRIVMAADAAGIVCVRVDNELVLRHDLGHELVEGGFGVMLERCDPDPSESTFATIRFGDVVIRR